MSAIRDFFNRKKAESKFKKAGPGHTLNESSKSNKQPKQTTIKSPPVRQSEESRQAAAAALARFEQKEQKTDWSQQAIRAQAKKELELENAAKAQVAAANKTDIVVQDACPTLTVTGVYFKCPLIGPEVLPLNEIKDMVRGFLYEQLEQERGLTACLIIHTLNENKEKVRIGIETLSRYITNILDNPTEEKYQKIRFNNKVFQERVVNLEGAFDFLMAVGFTRKVEGAEEYFVFDQGNFGDIENIQMLKEALYSAEPIIPVLDRNLKVLKPSQASAEIRLPNAFFNLTAEELKSEQEAKTESVDLLTQLRTKAMREKDSKREFHIYKYTLIRIRFPDGIILQGTFYVHEKFSAVKEFVKENLSDPEREFDLLLPSVPKLSETCSLLELKLVPAVLINFLWLDASMEATSSFLCPETSILLEDL